MRIGDMRHKEIINILDGARLGYICDAEIHPSTGRVTALIVPGPAKLMGIFGRELEYVIPWENIRKIGEDAILVELNPNVNQQQQR